MIKQPNIGEKLKKLRNDLNLSQTRFGARVGVSGKTISAYENNRCQPTLTVLKKISDVYGGVFLHVKEEYTDELERKIQTIKDYIFDIEQLFR